MAYKLEILGHAERDIKKAFKKRKQIAPFLISACREPAEDPRPDGYTPVERHKGLLWRITVKDAKPYYRVIYAIRDKISAVIIVAVRPRDEETYKNIPLKDLGKKIKELEKRL